MKTAIDLHTHTTASDGSYTPSELVLLASKSGLSAIAITDHDSVDGIDEAVSASAETNIEIVPGIEISVGGTDNMHILGFFVDRKNPPLTKTLDRLKTAREERNRAMIKKLQREGFDITYNEIIERTGAVNMGRLHIAQTIEKKGQISDYRKIFKKYMSEGSKTYVPREKLSEKEGIEAILAAGGLPFLAHINYLKKDEYELDIIIKRLKNLGMAGIEAYYSGYNSETEAMANRLAEKNGMLKSGGTDFHGTRRKGVYLGTGRGNMCVSYSLLEKIKQAAGIYQ